MSLAASTELRTRLLIGLTWPWSATLALLPTHVRSLPCGFFVFVFSLVLSGNAHMLNVKARTGKFCLFPLVPIRFDS